MVARALHPSPGTYRQGRLQSIPRYHLHGQARLRENLDCFLHASPGRVDDSDETQKRQLSQLRPGGQGQHCGQSSLETSSVTYALLRSILFSFQVFGDFPLIFLLLISSLASL